MFPVVLLVQYSKKVYKTLVKCFNSMPLYCLLEAGGHRMLLVHGGISPRFTSLDDLDAVHRQTEPATKTVLKVRPTGNGSFCWLGGGVGWLVGGFMAY